MEDALNQAVESGMLTATLAEGIKKFAPGTVCQHKNWGLGKITDWNIDTQRVSIDFESKKGFSMQFANAVASLDALPAHHILARRILDPAAVRDQAAADPIALVASILQDFGGSATTDQISAALVPAVFDLPAFKKWWDTAKKKLKGDGHFALPNKKNDPIAYHELAVSPAERLDTQMRAARFPKDQVLAADLIVREISVFQKNPQALADLAVEIESAARRNQKFSAPQAIELLLARDEIYKTLADFSDKPIVSFTVCDMLRSESRRLGDILAKLTSAKIRPTLDVFPETFGDKWQAIALDAAKSGTARLAAEIANFFELQKISTAFGAALAKWISERSATTELLIWLCRERGADFPEVFNADLLNAVFSALERDILDERRTTRLQDLLCSDKTLLADLLETADIDGVRDAFKRLQISHAFNDLDKRSLLARIIKLHPEMQSLVDDANAAEDITIVVSWPSLDARKFDLDNLIRNLIPQNIHDIAVAREQGDLRENFGFKAAKEYQRVLARRRAEMARDIAFARGTDFATPDTSEVSIGTTVAFRTADNSEQKYSILGAWDSDPDQGIVSYKAAIGQAFLGKKIGDTVTLPNEVSATILVITPFTDLDKLPAIHAR